MDKGVIVLLSYHAELACLVCAFAINDAPVCAPALPYKYPRRYPYNIDSIHIVGEPHDHTLVHARCLKKALSIYYLWRLE